MLASFMSSGIGSRLRFFYMTISCLPASVLLLPTYLLRLRRVPSEDIKYFAFFDALVSPILVNTVPHYSVDDGLLGGWFVFLAAFKRDSEL